MNIEQRQEIDLLQKQIPFIYDPETGKVMLTRYSAEGFADDLRYLKLRAAEVNSIEKVRELKAVIDNPEIQDMFLPFGKLDSASKF
jgi:hypothetical protein